MARKNRKSLDPELPLIVEDDITFYHIPLDTMELYAYGKLDKLEDVLQKHLEKCERCQGNLGFFTNNYKQGRKLSSEEKPSSCF